MCVCVCSHFIVYGKEVGHLWVLYCRIGKVVIRPIAFKPVVPNGVGHPPSGNKGVVTGGGQEGSIENGHSTFVTLQGRPDPRYTSTPTLYG
ncbi:hypothetical protein Anas_10062 [Armadillidium nasatum]|uniref:Uncharacterized protein n=1 Tax=Armadillidium nasatum TaxID=96803 RepID=A0A5N5TK65_9CRUS|nr:hypothetical protein Anas_10062 [Armadillidium nasatum]